MEVVVTTGAISRAKLQSIITTNKPTSNSFYRPDALPVAQPTVSKHWREKMLYNSALYKYAIDVDFDIDIAPRFVSDSWVSCICSWPTNVDQRQLPTSGRQRPRCTGGSSRQRRRLRRPHYAASATTRLAPTRTSPHSHRPRLPVTWRHDVIGGGRRGRSAAAAGSGRKSPRRDGVNRRRRYELVAEACRPNSTGFGCRRRGRRQPWV